MNANQRGQRFVQPEDVDLSRHHYCKRQDPEVTTQMSKTEEIQKLALMLDRIQQVRERFLQIRKGGPMFLSLSFFQNMEVQSRIQQKLDDIVLREAVEQWVAEEAKQIV